MGTERTFRGKTVVITGGAGGLGLGFGHRFAQAGARVALLDLKGKGVEEQAAQWGTEGVECIGIACDVTREPACREAMATVKARFGGIDVLINNAGITHRSAFADTRPGVFQRVMNVNFFGSLYRTQAALPSLMERDGLIIVISSVAGFAPLLGRSGYAASKHALHGLFETLRTELQKTGVDVMMVCPGYTATNISFSALDGDGTITKHPQSRVGKMASPAQVADAVFLGAEKGRRIMVLTPTGVIAKYLCRIWPAFYDRLMVRSLGGELER